MLHRHLYDWYNCHVETYADTAAADDRDNEDDYDDYDDDEEEEESGVESSGGGCRGVGGGLLHVIHLIYV